MSKRFQQPTLEGVNTLEGIIGLDNIPLITISACNNEVVY